VRGWSTTTPPSFSLLSTRVPTCPNPPPRGAGRLGGVCSRGDDPHVHCEPTGEQSSSGLSPSALGVGTSVFDWHRLHSTVRAVYAREFEERAQMRWSARCEWWPVNPSRKASKVESLADRRSPIAQRFGGRARALQEGQLKLDKDRSEAPEGFLEPPFGVHSGAHVRLNGDGCRLFSRSGAVAARGRCCGSGRGRRGSSGRRRRGRGGTSRWSGCGRARVGP
jgi:hypothetical protein